MGIGECVEKHWIWTKSSTPMFCPPHTTNCNFYSCKNVDSGPSTNGTPWIARFCWHQVLPVLCWCLCTSVFSPLLPAFWGPGFCQYYNSIGESVGIVCDATICLGWNCLSAKLGQYPLKQRGMRKRVQSRARERERKKEKKTQVDWKLIRSSNSYCVAPSVC